MNLSRGKILGTYLLAACALQACVYLGLSLAAGKYDWLFYFDPRLGIFFLESGLRGAEQVAPGVLRWLSVAWLLAVGVGLCSGRAALKTYIVSELVLSLPNLLFVLAVGWANLSPAHGFSVGELFCPALVMTAFSVVPLMLALRARSRPAAEFHPHSSSSGATPK
jgi:hypothetical protein